MKKLHYWWEKTAKELTKKQRKELAAYAKRHADNSRTGRRGRRAASQLTQLGDIGSGDFRFGAFVDVLAQAVAVEVGPDFGRLWLWDGSGEFDASHFPAADANLAGDFDPKHPIGRLLPCIIWPDHPLYQNIERQEGWATPGGWLTVTCVQVREFEGSLEVKAVDDTVINAANANDPTVRSRLSEAKKASQRRKGPVVDARAVAPSVPDGVLSLADVRRECEQHASQSGGERLLPQPVRVQVVSARTPISNFGAALCLECGATSQVDSLSAASESEGSPLICTCKAEIGHFVWDFVLRVRDATAALDVRVVDDDALVFVGSLPPTDLSAQRSYWSKGKVSETLRDLQKNGTWFEANVLMNGLPEGARDAITLRSVKKC
jgi:hypothetical protein